MPVPRTNKKGGTLTRTLLYTLFIVDGFTFGGCCRGSKGLRNMFSAVNLVVGGVMVVTLWFLFCVVVYEIFFWFEGLEVVVKGFVKLLAPPRRGPKHLIPVAIVCKCF